MGQYHLPATSTTSIRRIPGADQARPALWRRPCTLRFAAYHDKHPQGSHHSVTASCGDASRSPPRWPEKCSSSTTSSVPSQTYRRTRTPASSHAARSASHPQARIHPSTAPTETSGPKGHSNSASKNARPSTRTPSCASPAQQVEPAQEAVRTRRKPFPSDFPSPDSAAGQGVNPRVDNPIRHAVLFAADDTQAPVDHPGPRVARDQARPRPTGLMANLPGPPLPVEPGKDVGHREFRPTMALDPCGSGGASQPRDQLVAYQPFSTATGDHPGC
jgi:hypothetical protein